MHNAQAFPMSQLVLQVCDALLADPVDIPAMSGALRWISMGLTKELEKIREEAVHSFPIAVKAAQSKPFYQTSLQHLLHLSAAIEHTGPPLLATYSRAHPQVWFQGPTFLIGTTSPQKCTESFYVEPHKILVLIVCVTRLHASSSSPHAASAASQGCC